MGIFASIAEISYDEWFEYLIVFVAVMFVVTRLIQPTLLQIIALIAAMIVIYYRMDKRHSTTSNAYNEIEYRLKTLYPKPENFHMDSDIINLYYNMRSYRQYHSDGYDQSLVAVDNMLKLISEVEAGAFHCKENLDIIREQLNKALNHFHAIIFKVPQQAFLIRKHQRAMNALHVILRRHVDDVVRRCTMYYKERGMDIDFHPITNNGPRPDDTQQEDMSGFNFYY